MKINRVGPKENGVTKEKDNRPAGKTCVTHIEQQVSILLNFMPKRSTRKAIHLQSERGQHRGHQHATETEKRKNGENKIETSHATFNK